MGTIDLVMSREFAAPAQRVYEAFVTPALLSRWFGPVGWGVPLDTITIEPAATVSLVVSPETRMVDPT